MEKYDLAHYCANVLSPIFRLMGWTWGKDTPPTYNEIAIATEDLIKECKLGGTMGIGRIMVEKYKDEDGTIIAKVYLEIAEKTLD